MRELAPAEVSSPLVLFADALEYLFGLADALNNLAVNNKSQTRELFCLPLDRDWSTSLDVHRLN